MARTITMTQQASRPLAARPPHGNQTGGKPAHPVKPVVFVKRHPAHRGGTGGWATVVVIALTVAASGLWLWLGGGEASPSQKSAQLLAQMENAGAGAAVPTHVFGGALSVSRVNGHLNVVAVGVPSRACVEVGWRLGRQGTIIVNGTLPQRVSAARLAELCSGDGATLLWVPDE